MRNTVTMAMNKGVLKPGSPELSDSRKWTFTNLCRSNDKLDTAEF